MYRNISEMPIGIFDSGVGGVSVLADMAHLLPEEKFIYFADSKNAPYGVKNQQVVADYSWDVSKFLLSKGIKALVVACNTATAVAVNRLRETMPVPVIGMEPAVKPAIELGKEGKILVMATPVTLKQEKFNQLLHRFDEQARVHPLPCPGLVELVEQGKLGGELLTNYLRGLFCQVKISQVAVVVLGCTHYVFLKDFISEFFLPGTPMIDGNCGTAKHLKKVLTEGGLLNKAPVTKKGMPRDFDHRIQFYTSGDAAQVIPLCKHLFKRMLLQKVR